MSRADHLLVARGLAPTRSAAQRLIERGAVRWRSAPTTPVQTSRWAVPRKAGEDLPERCEIEITDNAELRWVSRGGLKLDAALVHTGIDLAGRVCLDVGQSTGGFTDVLLARGAAHVVGVDVGHGQLNPRLRADPRVTALEGVNARHLNAAELVGRIAGDSARTPPRQGPGDGFLAAFGLIVGDLSFISLRLVLPALAPLLGRGADLLLLVKPQFELQPAQIGKGGIVKDAAAHALVREQTVAACAWHDLPVRDYFASAVAGGDGNTEFFVWAHAANAAPEPRGGEAR